MRLLKLKLSALALVLASGVVGCGSSYSAYCTEKMDCEGGNDADLEACEISNEASEDVASVYGCDVEWEEFFLCVEEDSDCDNDVYIPDLDCLDKYEDYQDCVD